MGCRSVLGRSCGTCFCLLWWLLSCLRMWSGMSFGTWSFKWYLLLLGVWLDILSPNVCRHVLKYLVVQVVHTSAWCVDAYLVTECVQACSYVLRRSSATYFCLLCGCISCQRMCAGMLLSTFESNCHRALVGGRLRTFLLSVWSLVLKYFASLCGT